MRFTITTKEEEGRNNVTPTTLSEYTPSKDTRQLLHEDFHEDTSHLIEHPKQDNMWQLLHGDFNNREDNTDSLFEESKTIHDTSTRMETQILEGYRGPHPCTPDDDYTTTQITTLLVEQTNDLDRYTLTLS